LALHHYHDAHSVFPAGYYSFGTSDGLGPAWAHLDPVTWDASPGWGWGTMLLPFLEQSAVYDQLSLNNACWSTVNAAIVQEKLPVFLCPSCSGSDDAFLVQDVSGSPLNLGGSASIRFGRSHYVASHGQESCWGECGSAPAGVVFDDIYALTTRSVSIRGDSSKVADGPFYRNSRIRFRDIRDGTSNTIFLGEHSSRLSDKTWVGVVPGAFTHPQLTSPENGPDAAATLTLIHIGPSGGELDITGNPIIHPVNFPTYHVGQMYSEHAGGGHLCMGDGSVRFVSETIDLILFAELGSINEGEVSGKF